MLIAGYEIPDKCPDTCPYLGEWSHFDQGCFCSNCPVLNCGTDADGFCLCAPEDYRPEWVKEWAEFFRTGKEPVLRLPETKG